MRTLNSLLAPSILIIAVGVAFSFYSIPYDFEPILHTEQIRPGVTSIIIKYPAVIYPERQFGITLIVIGSMLTTLILTIQTAFSHGNRHHHRRPERMFGWIQE
jgi:hypothetical protein